MKKKFLSFTEYSGKTGTKCWDVRNKDSEALGLVYWFSRWRQYVYQSTRSDAILNKDCLIEIAEFCKEQSDIKMKRK